MVYQTRCPLANPVEYGFDPSSNVGRITVILHSILRSTALFCKGKLRFFTQIQFVWPPPPALPHPLFPHIARCFDEHHGITQVVQTGFYEQRRVDDKRLYPSSLRLGEQPANQLGHNRVNQRLQPSPLLGIGKDDPRHHLAIDPVVTPDHTLAPPSDQLRSHIRPIQGRDRQGVGIRSGAPEITEGPGNQALARTDSADQADDREPIAPS